MKFSILTLLYILLSQGAYSQVFTIDDKGIVKCPTAKVGDKGTIFGVTYEAVDNDLLIKRRDEGADLTKVCTTKVIVMKNLFWASTFNQPIGSWDVSNVIYMQGMFYNSQFNQPIGNWDVSSVIDMSNMFARTPFNQPIDNWNVSNVTNMASMFNGAKEFNQNIENWNVSKVTNMASMFASGSFNQPLNKWDVSKVTDFNWMFYNSKYNQPLNRWDIRNVVNIDKMFESSVFNQQIDNWDVSNIRSMENTFSRSKFNQPLNNWNVKNVVTMESMFSYSDFNQPIDKWDVGKVTNMKYMFAGSMFNHSLKSWCVNNIASEPINFSHQGALMQDNKPRWGICPGLPSKITQTAPSNNSIGVTRTPTLSWEPDSNATKYRLQVFEGFDPIAVDTIITTTNYLVGIPLKSNLVYNWKIQGLNDTYNRIGDWSDIWKFTTGTLTTLEDEFLPNGYALAQNFPNPFNPTTQISFTLPASATVRLEVFNSLGQPVSVLADGLLLAGSHSYTFTGASLPSGVYLYRLSSTEFTQTRTMVLLK